MPVIERLLMGAALFIAAHFAMGYINPSAGGTGGALIFPFATDAPSHWVFGSLERMPVALLAPVMIGLAGIAVLTFTLAFLATFGMWVPPELWRPLVLIGTACSAFLLIVHPGVWVVLPLALDAGLAWIAWTGAWSPITAAA
jgi:hypothetical protein